MLFRISTRMAEHGSIFKAMLQEFDEAARLLKLDPGIWNILTHPKRQIIVSCPVQMDNGEIEVFTGIRVEIRGTTISLLATDPDGGMVEVLVPAGERERLPFAGTPH